MNHLCRRICGRRNGFRTDAIKKSGDYTESVLRSFQGPPYVGSRVIAGPCGGPADPSTYKETIIWNFGSTYGDGVYPVGGIVVSKKGVIYGTTLEGGSGGPSGLGTIFTLTPSSSNKYKETVFSFTGTNGAYPYAAPTVDQNRVDDTNRGRMDFVELVGLHVTPLRRATADGSDRQAGVAVRAVLFSRYP